MQNRKQILAVGLAHKTGSKSEYKADAEQYTLVRKKMRAWSLKHAVRFYGFPDEVVAYYQNADFVQESTYGMKSYSNRFFTLVRFEPKRKGFIHGQVSSLRVLDLQGKHCCGDSCFSQPQNQPRLYAPAKPFEEVIAQKLQEMRLIENSMSSLSLSNDRI